MKRNYIFTLELQFIADSKEEAKKEFLETIKRDNWSKDKVQIEIEDLNFIQSRVKIS